MEVKTTGCIAARQISGEILTIKVINQSMYCLNPHISVAYVCLSHFVWFRRPGLDRAISATEVSSLIHGYVFEWT